ncbi:MAG: hypothetical protein HYV53_04685 [Parcubacteria group bacterium]|nr:hypothetical protein [Parcubacteria group bacterium]
MENQYEIISLQEDKESAVLEKNRKKENILENLKNKVDAVKQIKDIIETSSLEDSPGEVSKRFENFKTDIFARYPNALEFLNQIKNIEERIDNIERKIILELDPDDNEPEIQIFEEEQSKLFRQIDSIKKAGADDLDFLQRIDKGVNALEKKFLYVRNNQGNKPEIIAQFGKSVGSSENLDQTKVESIIIGPFSITIILEKNYYKKLISNEKTGMHINKTVFNVIKHSDSRTVSMIARHENIHNLLDGFSGDIRYPSQKFQIDLQGLLSPKGSDLNEKEKDILESTPNGVVDELRDELLADVGEIEANCMKPFYSNKKRAYVGINSALSEVEKINSLMKNFPGSYFPNEKIKKYFIKFVSALNMKFDYTAQLMRQALFVANRTETLEEIHSLLLLLKPSKYHHIQSYLSHFHPEKTNEYEGFSSLYEAFNSHLYPELVKKIVLIKDKLQNPEKELLATMIKNFDFSLVQKFNLESYEKVQSYLKDMRELANTISVDQQSIRYFLKSFMQNLQQANK